MMVEVGSLDALDVLSTAATVIAEGEVLAIVGRKEHGDDRGRLPPGHPRQDGGTLCGGGRSRPIIALTDKATRKRAQILGMNLGLAFQLVDDVLDYGGKGGRARQGTPATISARGKITLPVILCWRRGTAEERVFWREAIEKGRNDDQSSKRPSG